MDSTYQPLKAEGQTLERRIILEGHGGDSSRGRKEWLGGCIVGVVPSLCGGCTPCDERGVCDV
jgi:hypothetical protein